MLSNKDFENMPNNPLTLADGQFIWKKYGQIASVKDLSMVHPELHKLMANEVEPTEALLSDLVSFCVLNLENLNNPISSIKDFDERYNVVFELLKMDEDHIARKLIEKSHFWFRTIELAYFKLLNSGLYETWYSRKLNLHETNALLRRPIPDGVEAATLNARRAAEQGLSSMQEEIQKMEYTLFPDERTRKRISQSAIQNNLWAEKHAEDYVPVRS